MKIDRLSHCQLCEYREEDYDLHDDIKTYGDMLSVLGLLSANSRRDFTSRVLRNIDKRQDYKAIRDTFMEWCESPFSSSGSARRLRLHRNSLQYRLKKIRALTGKDPWKFKDAFDLWVAFSLKDMENLKS